ncbi:neurogenic differentiation factor 4-like [Dendronephthya gigantea]|uniref:neurogenic differentiation factor 4-like n=1 Tax=Dendronephthya gigantea TaxID=151771 RepID=UPI00106C4C66|nr:neurogenic differentiation factor 4-like [Dendronephthya gigantea]
MESVIGMNGTPYYGFNNCGILYAPSEQNNSALAAQRALEIYNLRARNAQIESGSQQQVNFAHPSQKRERKMQPNRSRTLYNKRMLVNARERERMKTLNKGFENLRNALPCYIADGHISKITTLRLAINYIRTLSAVLQDASNSETQTLVTEQQACGERSLNLLKTTDGTSVLPRPVTEPNEGGQNTYAASSQVSSVLAATKIQACP